MILISLFEYRTHTCACGILRRTYTYVCIVFADVTFVLCSVSAMFSLCEGSCASKQQEVDHSLWPPRLT